MLQHSASSFQKPFFKTFRQLFLQKLGKFILRYFLLAFLFCPSKERVWQDIKTISRGILRISRYVEEHEKNTTLKMYYSFSYPYYCSFVNYVKEILKLTLSDAHLLINLKVNISFRIDSHFSSHVATSHFKVWLIKHDSRTAELF